MKKCFLIFVLMFMSVYSYATNTICPQTITCVQDRYQFKCEIPDGWRITFPHGDAKAALYNFVSSNTQYNMYTGSHGLCNYTSTGKLYSFTIISNYNLIPELKNPNWGSSEPYKNTNYYCTIEEDSRACPFKEPVYSVFGT